MTGLLDRLVYLSSGLALILAFIGVKLILHWATGTCPPIHRGHDPERDREPADRDRDGRSGVLRLASDLAQPIDLLLTGAVMPGMLGKRGCRPGPRGAPGLPILYMSG